MDEKFVITGGCGFVGSNLCRFLSAQGKVLSIDLEVGSGREEQYDFCEHDLRKEIPEIGNYEKATVVHTAAIMKGRDLSEYWEVNVNGTINILDWAVKTQARHFIFISSGGIYGYNKGKYMNESDPEDPIGPYGYTKWIGEKVSYMYSKLHQLPITVIRLYFPYGPEQKAGIFPLIHHSVEKGDQLTIKRDGSPRFNPVHIDDLVSAIAKVIESCKGYRTYNVCGDDALSFLEIVRHFEKECGREANLIYSDEDEGDLLGSNSLIKEELGWKPQKKLVKEIGFLVRGSKEEGKSRRESG